MMETPLHVAGARGDVKRCKELLEEGADIHSRTPDGYTPLQQAARHGHLEAFRYLKDAGSDVHHKADAGVTVLHTAAEGGNTDILDLLLNDEQVDTGLVIDVENDSGSTPLKFAAANGQLQAFIYLMDKGSDINHKTRRGVTILHGAAAGGNVEILRLLVEKCAFDVDVTTDGGYTPLQFAADCGHLEAFRYLQKKGSNTRHRTRNGFTVLHSAAEGGNVDILKLLVEEARDRKDLMIDPETIQGYTPLQNAAFNGELAAFLYLKENGACTRHRSRAGVTILHTAAKGGHIGILKLLVEEARDRNDLNIDIETLSGHTPLHSAARQGMLQACRYLLGAGSNINHRSETGASVLHSAATSGNYHLIEWLVLQGISPEVRDCCGRSPFQYANGNKAVENILRLCAIRMCH